MISDESSTVIRTVASVVSVSRASQVGFGGEIHSYATCMKKLLRYLDYCGTLFSRIYLWPIYYVCGFLPRRANLWVFGSWGGYRFSDNAAAFFVHCHQTIADKVDVVWISRRAEIVSMLRERGFSAYWIWSPGGMLCCLRAHLFIFDSFSKDINFWLSRGSKKINLWSGVPLKKFEREIDSPKSRYYRLFHGLPFERCFLSALMPWHAIRPDLLIASSPTTQEITCRAFDVAPENVVITGYPRNDILNADANSADRDSADWPEAFRNAVENRRKIFLFLPTYRDSDSDYMKIEWLALNELMKRENAIFFYKYHPDDKGGFSGQFECVMELPQSSDIYSFLPYADALISDYSSIIFDFMLVNRPIVYFVPDIEEFVAHSRSLNFWPEDVAAGPVCKTSDELLSALGDIAADVPASAEQLEKSEKVRVQFNVYNDGHASQRVLEELLSRYMDQTPACPRD